MEMDSSPKPSVDGRTVRHAHRRPELLAAATEYVLHEGISGLSMRPLAAALGISHATLLHHFGSKQQLLAEVVDGLSEREAASLEPLMQGASPIDVTRAIWQRYRSAEGEAMFRLMFEAVGLARHDPDLYDPLIGKMVAPWSPAIERLIEEAGAPRDRAASLAALAVAQFRGLQLELLATGDKQRIDAAFDLFLEEFVVQVIPGR